MTETEKGVVVVAGPRRRSASSTLSSSSSYNNNNTTSNSVLYSSTMTVVLLVLVLLVSTSPVAATAAATASESSSSLPCQVIIDNQDVTEEYFVVNEDDPSTSYVDCVGHSKCREAVITNCPIINCTENEACNRAQIYNVTSSVFCNGLHSCHRTEITNVPHPPAPATTFVACIGPESCDVAQMYNIDVVKIDGVKAGRKVHIENAQVVKCTNGTPKAAACESFATFVNTHCFICGVNGCEDHINDCRYQLFDENNEDSSTPAATDTRIQYEKCQPETVLGGSNCPTGLHEELQAELQQYQNENNEEEEEEGAIEIGEVVVVHHTTEEEEGEGEDEDENNNSDEEEENDDGRRKNKRVRMMRGLI